MGHDDGGDGGYFPWLENWILGINDGLGVEDY